LPAVAALSLALSPALLRLGSGPRAYNGSPRVLGQFLYVAHLCTAYHAYTTGSAWTLAASTIAGAGIFLAAKFSAQALVLFALPLIAFVTPWYALLLLASCLAALVLSNGCVWRTWVGHVRHSLFYSSVLQRVFLYPYRRSLRDYVIAAWSHGRMARRGRLGIAVQWLFSERHPVHLFFTFFAPFLLLPLWLCRFGDYPPESRFLVVWAGAGFFWFIATSTERLTFLGEGERYLEYALVPATLLALHTLSDQYAWLVFAYLAYSAAAAAYFVREYVRRYRGMSDAHAESEQALARLAAMPPGVVMPIGSFHWMALCCTPLPVLTIGVNIDETLLPREDFKLVYGNYPYPSPRFDEIVARYDVRYVMSDKASLDYYAAHIVKDSPGIYARLDPVIEAANLTVWRVRRS
jgi:hypothetical protein